MPPNVLVIVADQLAASALGAYGNRVTQAPALDRLAAEGAVFEHAYCASPLCVPSRGAFMSGMLPSRNGAYDNGAELAASIPTFAHYLRVLGYRTVLAGKMHFVGPDQMHGFEERVTADVYPAGLDWVPDWRLPASERLPWYHDMSSVERAGPVRASLQLDFDEEVAFRARRAIVDSARAADGRPLLLVASFTHPHDPYEVPRRLWERYTDDEIELPRVPDLPFDGAGRPQPAPARDVRPRAVPRQPRAPDRGAARVRRGHQPGRRARRIAARDARRARHARRHDRGRHLRPRRHAGRTGPLVQDVVLRGLGAGAVHRAPPPLDPGEAHRRAGLAARPRPHARRSRRRLARRRSGDRPRRPQPCSAPARRGRTAAGAGARRVPVRGCDLAPGDGAARSPQADPLPRRPRPALRPRG